MHPKPQLALLMRLALTTLVAGVLVVGCGGGGGTSAGGGNTSGAATSTVVLQVSDSTVAAFIRPRTGAGPWQSIIETASELLIAPAFAQTGNIEVFLDGVSVGFVDDGGTIMFPATAGAHEITLSDGTVTNSFTVDVPADTIVTISDVSLDANQVSFGPPVVGDGTSDQFAKKTTICHKDRKTLSVGDPAVPAHLAHGDRLGPCNASPPVADDSADSDQVAQDSGPGNGNGNGNNGNGNGNGNNGNGNGNGKRS